MCAMLGSFAKRLDGVDEQLDADIGLESHPFPHFMLKEIHEQPASLERTLRDRIDTQGATLSAEGLGLPKGLGQEIERVYFIGCGTSHHATILGRYWFEKFARIPAVCELANEVRYREPVFRPGDLVIAVSQSGETADTLAALDVIEESGVRVLSIVNVENSSIVAKSDFVAYTRSGPEIGVASTKCFTAQLAVLLMLAIHLGRERGTLPEGRARELLASLLSTPHLIMRALHRAPMAKEAASLLLSSNDLIYIGRGLGYPIALEGALKIKESAYVHAAGYAGGELRHGPMALIEEGKAIIAISPRDSYHPHMLASAKDIRARGGRLIGICSEGDEEISEHCALSLEIPLAVEDIVPFLAVVPLQLLAYHVAVLKGTNVDQPRNLTKAVTEV